MLVERSYMLVKEGMASDFAKMMAEKAVPLLSALDGANEVRFGQGLEQPEKFILLIEWADMDAHMAFTKLPVFGEFRALLGPFTRGGEMEHFIMADR